MIHDLMHSAWKLRQRTMCVTFISSTPSLRSNMAAPSTWCLCWIVDWMFSLVTRNTSISCITFTRQRSTTASQNPESSMSADWRFLTMRMWKIWEWSLSTWKSSLERSTVLVAFISMCLRCAIPRRCCHFGILGESLKYILCSVQWPSRRNTATKTRSQRCSVSRDRWVRNMTKYCSFFHGYFVD